MPSINFAASSFRQYVKPITKPVFDVAMGSYPAYIVGDGENDFILTLKVNDQLVCWSEAGADDMNMLGVKLANFTENPFIDSFEHKVTCRGYASLPVYWCDVTVAVKRTIDDELVPRYHFVFTQNDPCPMDADPELWLKGEVCRFTLDAEQTKQLANMIRDYYAPDEHGDIMW